MDIRKIKKLIELLEKSSVSEIEVCEGEESVRISQHNMDVRTQRMVQAPEINPTGTPVSTAGSLDTGEVSVSEEGHVITSPMVGIFYAAPVPDEPPFVNVGQSIRKGDVVCVLEAMKIMNQIETDVSGIVAKIHAGNGEAVEYGQTLFTIRESG